ncbi:hypothetical protein EVAR_77520_1 [Eumeta japonica]|uniref:Uncharacterized protein n=1 Tax=Eumeta variegata TaxID=151549 RepID=A0A4C1T6H4_EUMVA|nr:hypothetical protein EVAR_77520_1 [Eumeta japonica]
MLVRGETSQVVEPVMMTLPTRSDLPALFCDVIDYDHQSNLALLPSFILEFNTHVTCTHFFRKQSRRIQTSSTTLLVNLGLLCSRRHRGSAFDLVTARIEPFTFYFKTTVLKIKPPPSRLPNATHFHILTLLVSEDFMAGCSRYLEPVHPKIKLQVPCKHYSHYRTAAARARRRDVRRPSPVRRRCSPCRLGRSRFSRYGFRAGRLPAKTSRAVNARDRYLFIAGGRTSTAPAHPSK